MTASIWSPHCTERRESTSILRNVPSTIVSSATIPNALSVVQITSSPAMPARNVLSKGAQFVTVSLNATLVTNPTTTSLSTMDVENARFIFARSVLVGTFVKIVGHWPISDNPTKFVYIGSSTTSSFSS